MNGNQLKRIIENNRCLKSNFKGIFARDTLPTIVDRYPAMYVVNTDCSFQKGQHWVAIFLMDQSYGVFFDSFGRTPDSWGKEFTDFMDDHVGRYDYYIVALQSHESDYCGLFVLAFLYITMCMSVTIEQFQLMFKKKLKDNDALAYSFVKMFL